MVLLQVQDNWSVTGPGAETRADTQNKPPYTVTGEEQMDSRFPKGINLKWTQTISVNWITLSDCLHQQIRRHTNTHTHSRACVSLLIWSDFGKWIWTRTPSVTTKISTWSGGAVSRKFKEVKKIDRLHFSNVELANL